MINKDVSPTIPFPVSIEIPAEIGRARRPAVSAESCLGDRFLVEGIDDTIQILWGDSSQIELITHSLDGCNAVQTQLLTNLTNMDIDGSIPYNHFISPDLVQDLIS